MNIIEYDELTIKAGQIYRCIKPYENFLTVGDLYVNEITLRYINNQVMVKDDMGSSHLYDILYFTLALEP